MPTRGQVATERDLFCSRSVLGLPDRTRALERDPVQCDALAGKADLEDALTKRRTTLDELAEGVWRHRIRDSPPLDEGKDGMDPSHLDIGGVEAHPRQDRHHRCLERQPLL